MSYQNYSAFMQAKEETRRQISKQMSQLSFEIDEMVSTISESKISMDSNCSQMTTATIAAEDESDFGLMLPGFNPVCSNNYINALTDD